LDSDETLETQAQAEGVKAWDTLDGEEQANRLRRATQALCDALSNTVNVAQVKALLD